MTTLLSLANKNFDVLALLNQTRRSDGGGGKLQALFVY